jgi:hypothetical protein
MTAEERRLEEARSRAYRWGEDGLAGICDNHQRLCFAIALWNGRDPILKERAFGLTGKEGNHGEDVKEYYTISWFRKTDAGVKKILSLSCWIRVYLTRGVISTFLLNTAKFLLKIS